MTATTSAPTTRWKSQAAAAIALSVFRIVFGLLFTIHGTSKLFGWPDGAPAALGAWPVWWAGLLELVLGGLIALGLLTRPAAFIASGMMAVAYFWMHFPDGFWPSVNGGEAAVLYCFAFLLLVFTGPGRSRSHGASRTRSGG